jgi:hypothetical protein
MDTSNDKRTDFDISTVSISVDFDALIGLALFDVIASGSFVSFFSSLEVPLRFLLKVDPPSVEERVALGVSEGSPVFDVVIVSDLEFSWTSLLAAWESPPIACSP